MTDRRIWRTTTPSNVDDELSQHFEMLVDRYVKDGLSQADARAKATERFGELKRIREECHILADQMEHTVKRREYFDEIRHDIIYATRLLRRAPAFTLVAILTLAIGIGANTAIFSVIRSVLLRPLPYPNPEQLVQLWTDHRALGRANPEWFTPPELQDWRTQNTTFSGMAAYQGGGATLTDAGDPESIPGFLVSGDFFDVLGVHAAKGRLLTVTDDDAAAEPVVVISNGLWQRRFGSDSSVIGRRLTLNGNPWTVVGILPPAFHAPVPTQADIFRPMRRPANGTCGRSCIVLRVIGRMKPGVTLAQAQADASGIAARLAQQYPETNAKVGAWLIPLHEQISGPSKAPLYAMGGAVALVLLIACVNLANLLLARGAVRGRELAVRAALGAGDTRILRQLVTENALLALAGGSLGLIVGVFGSSVLATLVPDSIRAVQVIRVDTTVLLFSAGITALAAMLFGLLPALRATRANSHESLRSGTRAIDGIRSRLRGSLVVAQISLAVVLLVGAGLLMRSFLMMQRVDLGYRSQGIFMAGIALPAVRYRDPAATIAAINDVLGRLRSNPAIASADVTDLPPLAGGGDQDILAIPIGEAMTGKEPPSIWYRAVTPGYLSTMHMRIVSGRGFTGENRAGSAPVGIVNEEAAEKYWHGTNPVGRVMAAGRDSAAPRVTIIGVVASARHDGPNQPYKPEIYLPYEQFPARAVTFVIEPKSDRQSAITAFREALKATDPLVPSPNINDIESIVGDAVALPRLYATLISIFASAALLLAALGVYGVMAFSVAQRQRELGVRLALGAAPTSIMGMILREGGRFAILGVLIGFAAALALGRTVSSLLFGVTPFDLPTFLIATIVLAIITLMASVVPAIRAMRVDLLSTIRAE